MLTKQKLTEMNSRGYSHPGVHGMALYAALGAAVAGAAAALLVSYAVGTAILVLGGSVAFLLSRRGARAPKVELFYALDPGAGARFSEVQKACEALAASEKVWRVDEERGMGDGSLAPAGTRHPVSIGLLETPGFSANVAVWGIEDGETSLFLLPECVLSRRDGLYRPISYDAFGVVYGQSRRLEDAGVPGDAEVVGEAAGLMAAAGARRGTRAPEHPVVAYGLLAITGLAEGETMRLLVSNKARAVRFARPFGAGKDEDPRADARTAREARARRNAKAEKNGKHAV